MDLFGELTFWPPEAHGTGIQGTGACSRCDVHRSKRFSRPECYFAAMTTRVRTLLLDNYDSYTYNLFQLLAEVNGAEPMVVTNDRISLEAVAKLVQEGAIDNIVISPGPGTPECSGDIGVCLDVLRSFPNVPILGVCLGHQALAHVHGGRVIKAPEPVHGRVSSLEHAGHTLLHGIPSGQGQGFDVVRYHSLVVDAASLPSCLEPIAWTCGQHHAVVLQKDSQQAQQQQQEGEPPATPPMGGHGAALGQQGDSFPESVGGAQQDKHQGQGQQGVVEGVEDGDVNGGCARRGLAVPQQGLVMALAHKQLPHFGVQFHPESVSTCYGIALLHNFGNITRALRGSSSIPRPIASLVGPPGQAAPPRPWPSQEHQRGAELALSWQRLPGLLQSVTGGSEAIFRTLYGWQHDTFWLDSAATDRGRFSYMGGRGGRLWRRISYRLPGPTPLPPSPVPSPLASEPGQPSPALPLPPGLLEEEDWQGRIRSTPTHFLTFLEGLLRQYRLAVTPGDALGLPFSFWGGLVGYLGYELKAECGAANAHRSETPDAAFLLADQFVAVDHAAGDVYVLAMYRPGDRAPGGLGGEGEREAKAWLQATVGRLETLAAAGNGVMGNGAAAGAGPTPASSAPAAGAGAAGGEGQRQDKEQGQGQGPVSAPPFRLRHSREAYMANIEAYRQALYDGESYEVCATTALERPCAPDPAQLYSTLRRLNPAPYAAWLRLGGPDGLAVCCSSPERFLCCLRGSVLEARPIKGTAPRRMADPQEDARLAAELASSEKERAENLMIVDLLRNDLGRVCEVGSVHVPGLMEIESFATVHQMVSTVRGLRRPDASIVDCLRAAFPGGSMTGAPKVRTMEILDAHEGRARGIYSGSLGYISFNDTFDLNIVIRTAVIHERQQQEERAEVQHLPAGLGPDATSALPVSSSSSSGVNGSGSGWVSIGAGGAIVVQSDTGAEYEEMRLKARALLAAIGACDGLDGPAVVDDVAPAYQRGSATPATS